MEGRKGRKRKKVNRGKTRWKKWIQADEKLVSEMKTLLQEVEARSE